MPSVTSSGPLALRVGVAALLATVPFASTVVAVAVAPPAHVEIAGQTVSVQPVIGRDTSRLLGGALVRPEHEHLGLIDKDIGVDIDGDWNRLIPSDKRTRAYLTALWDDPTPQIDRIRHAARRSVIVSATGGFAAGLVVVAVVGFSLRYRRRRLAQYAREQADLVQRHNQRLRRVCATVGLLSVVVLDVVALRVYGHEEHHVVDSSPLLAGTTLEGTEVNGLAAAVLPFLSILRPRTTFYDAVAVNLEEALAAEPSLRRSDDEVVLVLAEDFEDVDGMARQVGLATNLVDANFIAITGDITFGGTAVETYLIDTIDYYSDGTPVYFTPGLHDTQIVVDTAERRGWHVADGTTTEVDGLTLLTAPDPRISTVGSLGSGDVLRDPDVDVERFVGEAVEEACAERPDLVLLHDHVLGRRIAAAGCQEIALLDGRSFTFVGPQTVPTGSGATSVEFTGGSTGGHRDTKPNPGAITHPASFSILTVDPAVERATYAVVTVRPDRSVSVTPEIDLAVPWQKFLRTGQTGQ